MLLIDKAGTLRAEYLGGVSGFLLGAELAAFWAKCSIGLVIKDENGAEIRQKTAAMCGLQKNFS